MFDAVVQVKLLQIERILAVVLLQQAGSIMWHEGAKRSAKVIGRANLVREVGELDPSSTARNDA